MTPQPSATKPPTQQDNPPWWRVGMVWLVLAGPLAVVVASSATAVIAWRGADPPLATGVAHHSATAQVPALQGRNHAATPVQRRGADAAAAP